MSLRAHLTARVGRLDIDVTLDTAPGTLVVVGPNGAGKSTLLSLLVGALPATEGRVQVGDDVLLDTTAAVDVPIERRGLGYLPQDYALFPHLTVRGNVDFAVASRAPRPERAARVETMLRELDLEALADRRPDALSGGEKQRVALARALSVAPRALLLDEPLAALDVSSRRGVRTFLAALLARLALPAIVVTHDPDDARALGQRVAVLEAGRITQTGTWSELVAAPRTPFARALVGHED